MKSPAVGADDLTCHGQSEAVGGVWQWIQILQHFFRYTLPVVRDYDENIFSLRGCGDGDVAGAFIVGDAVLQQIVESPYKERFISEDHRLATGQGEGNLR